MHHVSALINSHNAKERGSHCSGLVSLDGRAGFLSSSDISIIECQLKCQMSLKTDQEKHSAYHIVYIKRQYVLLMHGDVGRDKYPMQCVDECIPRNCVNHLDLESAQLFLSLFTVLLKCLL